MNFGTAALLLPPLIAGCAAPEPRLSYEERFPDWQCRKEAFAAKSAAGCLGCFTPSLDTDRVLEEAYRRCVAGKAE